MSIQAEDVVFGYPGNKGPAVDGVSAEVESSEVVGIVGPNGSGKSTLGRLMKGLYIPSGGSVLVDSINTARDPFAARRTVGLVFQNPNSQIVNGVIENEVAFGPENLGMPSGEIQARITRALAAVGLTGREAEETHSLSMADKQRVAIASVMAIEPKYLILDEATTWLEPAVRSRILDQVFVWARERGVGLVLITHRMDEALLCDRVYGMLNGKIEAAGTAGELLGDEALRTKLSLSIPDSMILADRLRTAGAPVPATASLDRLAEALCRS